MGNELRIKLQPKQKEAFRVSLITSNTFYGGSKGGGKIVANDGLVLTPFGFRKGKSLKVGQLINNPDGSLQRIIQIKPEISLPLWRVHFSDRTYTDVAKDHLWLVWKSNHSRKIQNNRKSGVCSAEVVETKTLLDWLEKGYKPQIPICEDQPFNMTTKWGLFDPYLIGVLLGDGCITKNNLTITCSEEDKQHYRDILGDEEITYTSTKTISFIGEKKKEIKNYLRSCGLDGKYSHNKFIPNIYKYSSVESRYQLIRGILDTDGYNPSGKQGIYYTSISRRLAEDTAFVLRSLGSVVTITESMGSYKKNGEKIVCAKVYDLYIKHRNPDALFKMVRKKKLLSPKNISKRVVKVEILGEITGRCITVSNQNGLYLTNDFIVTHNSYLVRAREIYRRLKYPGTKGLIVRKTYPELYSNHITKIFQEYPQIVSWYNKAHKVINWPNGSITEFSYMRTTDDVYTYQGREYEDISIDEVTQHDYEVVRVLKTSLRTTRKDIKPTLFLTGNPGGPGHMEVKRIFVDRTFKNNENPDDYAFVQAFVQDNNALMDADPEYIQRLHDLPEHLRKAYLEGDWNIFAGQAFSELSPHIHIVEPFELPPATRWIAGFDPGYNHPFSFVLAGVVPDGQVYITQHFTGRLKETPEIVQGIVEHLRGRQCDIYCGHDLWYPGRGGGVSEYENFRRLLNEAGHSKTALIKAKTNHRQGIAQIRKYITSKNEAKKPLLYFFKNEPTVDVFNTLCSLQFDPKDPEDVVKLDADENGNGGDDAADSFRYLVMSRAYPNQPEKSTFGQFSGQSVLENLMEEL